MQPNTAEALKLWAWIVSGVLVLIVGILAGEIVSWSCASITLQLLGSLLTFLGFQFAYLRASHQGETVGEQLKLFGRRLIGKPLVRSHTGSANLNFTVLRRRPSA